MEQGLNMMSDPLYTCVWAAVYVHIGFLCASYLKVKQQFSVSHLAAIGGSVLHVPVWCRRVILAPIRKQE